MTGNTPTLQAPTPIPNDLYRTIAEYLHKDKHTLCALALASKTWCAESQRLLFRTVLDEGRNIATTRYTHCLFFNAIIRNPTLGSYVHAYSQHGLICYSVIYAPTSSDQRAVSTMLTLTKAALPLLVNLKHLCIDAQSGDQEPEPLLELKGCTFSLRSLAWGFHPSNSSITGPWNEFLRTQHELVHLEVGGVLSYMQDLSWLADDTCPNLRSAVCQLPSPIVHRPTIVGLATLWSGPGDPDKSQVAALRRLKYLSVPTDLAVIAALGGTNCNLVLLEISGWEFEQNRLLPDFPNLRVLVFTHILNYWGVAAMEDAMTQMTVESFRLCPVLEYIVMEDAPGYDGRRRYRKLTITDPTGRPLDAVPDIKNEEFIMERVEQGKFWWTAYGV